MERVGSAGTWGTADYCRGVCRIPTILFLDMSVTPAKGAGASVLGALSNPDRLLEILDGLGEAVYLVDRSRAITFWNRSCERITGFTASEVVGRRCFDAVLRHVDQNGTPVCFSVCPLARTMQDGQPRQARLWLHHKRGHRLAVRIRAEAIRGEDGRVVGAIETFSDDSALPAGQARLAELDLLALVDPATQIPNREFLDLTLATRLIELRRHGPPFAVVLCDIDEFRDFNAEHGRGVGDQIVRVVATTLAAELRGSDTVVRFGGDEFVLLLHHACDEAPQATCERLRMLVAASSLDLSDRRLQATMSFGATLATRRDTPDTVLWRADHLLYESKRRGRNRVSTDIEHTVTTTI